jgi:hypothetical protein
MRELIERVARRGHELDPEGFASLSALCLRSVADPRLGGLSSASFEEAVVQVVNLGGDADMAGRVVGAWHGVAYGLSQIAVRWRSTLCGEWPLRSGER